MEKTPGPSRSRCEFDASHLIVRLSCTVEGRVERIPSVVAEIMDVVHQMGCAAGKEWEIELAIQEALANAIVHGCKRDPGRHVHLWVGCDESKWMIIGVRDPGEGFDPASVPSPTTGRRLFAQGGRGIYLINQLMDEVRFEEGGTEIWMRKR